ncbi:hypothetical protein SALWKB29_1347 [Snodgrassella communis]|uniref:Uncharacterized protein n=1 Tax=Snodgrassella communis TaxID=2946699 RepID=A0A837B1Y5_9NEIS|nr:hypothetical protein SALWKB29_1347 [Snodgrassella communis]
MIQTSTCAFKASYSINARCASTTLPIRITTPLSAAMTTSIFSALVG